MTRLIGIYLVTILVVYLLQCIQTPVEDEPLPIVTLVSAEQNINETIDTVRLIASLSKPSASSVIVPFSINGTALNDSDFTLSANSFFFPAGLTQCTTFVIIQNDKVIEDNETIIISLSNDVHFDLGSVVTSTITIISDDQPKVNMLYDDRTFSRRSGSFVIAARLSQPTIVPVTVPFTLSGSAVAPTHHNLTDGVLTFASGDTISSKTVEIVNDSAITGFKNIIVTLGTPQNAQLGDDTTNQIIFAYDSIVNLQILDTEFPDWKQSQYEADFRVVEGDSLYTVINGGALPYIEMGYKIALRQVMFGNDNDELEVMAMYFGTSDNADSMYQYKKDIIGADSAISGYDTTMVSCKYNGINTISIVLHNNNLYMEIVISGTADEQELLLTGKLFVDYFINKVM